MPRLLPGDPIDYVVTYLEMTQRPRSPVPARPVNQNVALLAASDPPVAYFLYLYKTVGAPHEWTDWLEKSAQEQQAFVSDSQVFLYTQSTRRYLRRRAKRIRIEDSQQKGSSICSFSSSPL